MLNFYLQIIELWEMGKEGVALCWYTKAKKIRRRNNRSIPTQEERIDETMFTFSFVITVQIETSSPFALLNLQIDFSILQTAMKKSNSLRLWKWIK